MMKIIKPKDQKFHQATIGSFLDLLNVYHNRALSEEEQAKTIFMIAEDERRGVYGGAMLSQQKVESLQDKIANIIASIDVNHRDVWVANLCFHPVQNEPFSPIEQAELCHNFYNDLLKKFHEFGNHEKISFLVLSLQPMDFFKSKTYGQWPYLLEISPKDSLDSLFHGILALKPQKPLAPKSSWLAMECLNQLRRGR